MTNPDAFIVLGATGHIGSVVARTLLRDGHQVIAVVHDEGKAGDLKSVGAEIAVVDVGDTQALRATLRRGRRAFLLNPPAPVTADTDGEENRTASSIAEAVVGAGLEKVLLESTYGAQPGDAIGDLSVLWNFERAVGSAAIPMAINRGAYYFTNLDMLVEEARQGSITTMFPPHLKIPMVAPADLGLAAARRLASPLEDVGVRYVEGPETYSFNDVAAAFAKTLGHAVTVRTIERNQWEASFRQAGFSERAARAYARMTEVSLAGFDRPEDPIRGTTSLLSHISRLVDARTSAK
jgi:uncharacterized protein YbjT (DUF2867 family)